MPLNGIELYEWSNILKNCLAGYGELISEYGTLIYGFFKKNKLLFAVEIQNNKIVQAKSKYNKDLTKDEMAVVLDWHKKFISKKQENEKNIIYPPEHNCNDIFFK